MARGAMGRYSANERIGVYVRQDHWAHALIAQNVQLSAALDADDDVLLKRLLAAGASPNTANLSGQTLLAVAIAEGRTRCRAVLEAAGANRGLPKRPSKHASDKKKSDGAPTDPKKLKGSGLTSPPASALGAAWGELCNGLATFNLHWKRAMNTGDTLCDDEAASSAEKSWMLACTHRLTVCRPLVSFVSSNGACVARLLTQQMLESSTLARSASSCGEGLA